MDIPNDNIVGRLYLLINNLKECHAENTEDAFCKVFELEKNDKALIYQYYAEMFKMALTGIAQIKKCNPKHIDKYINILNCVIDGLSKVYFNATAGALNNGLEKFESFFDNSLMVSLEFCAELLSNNSNEQPIEDEIIKDLINEINDLIEYVFECNLNQELEKIVIYHLNNTRESLIKYKYFGGEAVKDNISTTLGTLIMNRDKVNNENDTNIVEKVFMLIAKINSIFSISSNGTKMLDTIKKIITND